MLYPPVMQKLAMHSKIFCAFWHPILLVKMCAKVQGTLRVLVLACLQHCL